MKINYKAFIEDNYWIKDKEGNLVRFILNDTQNYYWDMLKQDYPELQGIRENILKFRQPGFSSLITGIFNADFCLSELGEIPIINSDVYSHKDSETTVHFQRFNMFTDSFLLSRLGGSYGDEYHRRELPRLRKEFLKIEAAGVLIGKRGAEYHAQTASAKVSGRGGTKQNIHWSEPAFYSNTQIINAKDLIVGAEEQVASGRGKIFRETTGNAADGFFPEEYEKGKSGLSEFKSRFLGWFIHHQYSLLPPTDWEPPAYYDKVRRDYNTTREQCYWHFVKTRGLTDEKRMREYPTDDTEAFLLGGSSYFDKGALLHYKNAAIKPIKEVEFVGAL